MTLLRNPLFLLSTLFSLFYAWQGLQLARTWWARRDAFRQEPLQPWKQHLAERASFLLAIPPGVLIHELGHALAVWLFDGRVVGFGFWLYWGYVLPEGSFNAAEDWFISLAGTLGTLAYAVGLWLLLGTARSTPVRYFLLRAFRFQLYYALIYYPIFTVVTFVGDWRTIYDFEATPLLSGATAVAHAALFGTFWWLDRRGRFEMPAFESAELQNEYAGLGELANPDDGRAQLRRIDLLRAGGAANRARSEVETFLNAHPQSAEAHLMKGALLAEGKQQVPLTAVRHFRQALELGLGDPVNVASAHLHLGQYELAVDRPEQALAHYDDGLAALAAAPSDKRVAQWTAYLHYLRAAAHRRSGHPEAARQDLETAARLAEANGNPEAAKRYRQSL